MTLKNIIKETINNFIYNQTSLINEYLDKEHDIPLKNYLSLTDEQKAEDMIYTFYYMFPQFIKELYNYDEIDDEEYNNLHNLAIDLDYDLPDEIIYGSLTNLKKQFIDFIIKNTYNLTDELPAHQSFDEAIPVKNEWLIHFTDNALQIAQNGFQYGTEDIDRLNYTNAGSIQGKSKGYNFAYTINDYDRFYRGFHGQPKYGNEAVLLQASGIKTWHYGDEEYQVIFWGQNAKNIIPIIQNSDGYWTILSSKTSNKLIEFENLEDIVNWVMNNKEQYRKHLYYNNNKPRTNK